MDEAEANHAVLGNQLAQKGIEEPGADGDRVRREIGARIQAAKIREFNPLGIIKGYRYEDSPVIVPDGTEPPPIDFINYIPSARPGAIAPHAWMHDGTSLYDKFGRGFTLVVATGIDPAECAPMVAAARAATIPLDVLQCDEPAVTVLYGRRFTLIRPDQHVAWRGDSIGADARRILARVTGAAG